MRRGSPPVCFLLLFFCLKWILSSDESLQSRHVRPTAGQKRKVQWPRDPMNHSWVDVRMVSFYDTAATGVTCGSYSFVTAAVSCVERKKIWILVATSREMKGFLIVSYKKSQQNGSGLLWSSCCLYFPDAKQSSVTAGAAGNLVTSRPIIQLFATMSMNRASTLALFQTV